MQIPDGNSSATTPPPELFPAAMGAEPGESHSPGVSLLGCCSGVAGGVQLNATCNNPEPTEEEQQEEE